MAIMAGFLPGSETGKAEEIAAELAWLWSHDVCKYTKSLPSGDAAVLWRCSLNSPAWRADRADSIDFSGYVLGLAGHFLPADFYPQYAP